MILEVIAFNIESCSIIEKCGAHRIELCGNPGEGGTTPSYGMIAQARKKVIIDLFPIIRPRGGDFLYSTDEFQIMKSDIVTCKKLSCDGVVFGMLNADGTVDKRCAELVEIAYPLEATFHRAFDRVKDASNSLEEIINIGFTRILTSGLQPTASEGATTIASLIKQARERIIIMPGSGVRSGNIIDLLKKTCAVEFHTSARMTTKSKMDFVGNLNENLQTITVDVNEVATILNVLKNNASNGK